MRSFLIALSVFVIAQSAAAQPPRYESHADEGRQLRQLVDELNGLIDKADRQRAADPKFLADLRRALARYDWPWTALLLHDDFRDGDYTRNPTWRVSVGQFSVRRGVLFTQAAGQQARAPASREGSSGDLGALLGDLLERYGQQRAQQQGEAPQEASLDLAEIYTPVRIGNAFAVTLVLGSRSDEGRLELGPYPGGERTVGYRLAYTPGGHPSLELLRVSSRGSSVIEAYNPPVRLEDGKPHTLQWTRSPAGEMRVALDGKALMETTDRGIQDDFSGFTIANLGGDYAIDEVTVEGTR